MCPKLLFVFTHCELCCLNLTTYLIIRVTVKFQGILFLSGAIFTLVLRDAPLSVLAFRVPFPGWSFWAIRLTGPGGCWEWRRQSHKSLHLLLWQHVSVFASTAPNIRLQTIDRPDTGATFLILLGSWNGKLGLLLGRPVSTAEMWSCIRVEPEVMCSGALSSAQLRKASCWEEIIAGLEDNLIRIKWG